MLVIVIVYYLVTSVSALILGMVQPFLGIPEVVIQLTQFDPTLGVLIVILMISRRSRPPFTLKQRLNPLDPRRFLAAALFIVMVFVLSWLWYLVHRIRARHRLYGSFHAKTPVLAYRYFPVNRSGWRRDRLEMLPAAYAANPNGQLSSFRYRRTALGRLAHRRIRGRLGLCRFIHAICCFDSVLLGELLRGSTADNYRSRLLSTR